MNDNSVFFIGLVLGMVVTAGLWGGVNSIDNSYNRRIYNSVNKYISSNSEISAKTTYTCLRRKLTGNLIFPDDLIDIKYLKECLNAK